MKLAITAVAAAALCTGCMTLRRGPAPPLPVATNPPGAAIVLDGVTRGTTPARIPVQGNTDHELVLQKPCFAPTTVQLRRDFGTAQWLFSNLIFPVVGHAVDVATGSAWRVYPQAVDATLEPAPCPK